MRRYRSHSMLILSITVLLGMLVSTMVHAEDFVLPSSLTPYSSQWSPKIGDSLDSQAASPSNTTFSEALLNGRVSGYVNRGLYLLQYSTLDLNSEHHDALPDDFIMTLGVGYGRFDRSEMLGIENERPGLFGSRDDQYRIDGPLFYMTIGGSFGKSR